MNYRFEVLDKTTAHQGFFRLETYRLRHELFAGGWTSRVYRECLERGHAVAVLPYDPARDCVVMVEQFRIGALESPGGPWLLEIVAGIIEPGEGPETVARRETVEEAGCPVQDLVPIMEGVHLSPGGSSETITLFCGRVDSRQTQAITGVAEEHEDIRVHVLPRDEALAQLAAGRIKSATPVMALQWLALNHPRLREQWRA